MKNEKDQCYIVSAVPLVFLFVIYYFVVTGFAFALLATGFLLAAFAAGADLAAGFGLACILQVIATTI